jgi:phage terminase large subunit GpA-like protein
MNAPADGFLAWTVAFARALKTEPDFTVDAWADAFMVIPRGPSAEPGPYRTDRTPYARRVMQALSPSHPARRVIVMAASQLLKTQVALNWLASTIHQAPANALFLLPTDKLAKRVSKRIDKTIRAVPVLRQRVAKPRSRNASNTIDTKEYSGGTLYITTAGSAANLAEVPVRYVYGDEIDRWDENVGGEGDPIQLAENRTSTFGKRAKLYYTSTPTIKGLSAIQRISEHADEYRWQVPCPHCAAPFEMQWESVRWTPDYARVWIICPSCGAEVEESSKSAMLAGGDWLLTRVGNGTDVAFVGLSALNAPLGWVSWQDLARQYDAAKLSHDRGEQDEMQAFWNTRLARTWEPTAERASAEAMHARAETWTLGALRPGVLYVTAAVDVQANRLEYAAWGWGEGLERWWLDHRVLFGDPSEGPNAGVWRQLSEILDRPYAMPGAVPLPVEVCLIDSGGHNTEDVYAYVRARGRRRVLAIKGASTRGRPVIDTAQASERNWQGKAMRQGVKIWRIGTDTAKDWLHSRWMREAGPGAIHFPADLPEDVYRQLVSEAKVSRKFKGRLITEWVHTSSDRNEGLDLAVYNLAAAHYLGLQRKRAAEWAARRTQVEAKTGDLFASKPPAAVQSLAPAPPSALANIDAMIAAARARLGA